MTTGTSKRFSFPTHQLKSEFLELVDIFIAKKPRTILEIGQWEGGTLKFWMEHATAGAKVIALDVDHSRLGDNYKQWLDGRFDFYRITADSTDSKTLEIVKSITPSIEFLFIDGSHLYDDVKADFEMYGSLVQKNGIIALHDIHNGQDQKKHGWGTSKLWSEIKNSGLTLGEIVHSKEGSKTSNGIGIVYK